MTHDAITHLADDLTSSFIKLEKEISEKRSGIDRRKADPDSARNFKQEVEREYRAEIRQLRDESAEKSLEISVLRAEIAEIRSYLKTQEPTLTAATMIVQAGMVFRYLIVAIVGITAAIGGISAMVEAFKQWVK
jgi:chromosome segregation ATPase